MIVPPDGTQIALQGLPLAALNAPKELTSRVSQVGFAGLSEDERLRASVVIPGVDPVLSAKEIRRVGGMKFHGQQGFAQIYMSSAARMPLGQRFYVRRKLVRWMEARAAAAEASLAVVAAAMDRLGLSPDRFYRELGKGRDPLANVALR